MTDVHLGLVVTTSIIVGFSVALCRVGALQRYSAAIAVVVSCVIAVVLFFQQ
jgi:hypothetical protein